MGASDLGVAHLVGDVDAALYDLFGYFLIGLETGSGLTGVLHFPTVVLAVIEFGVLQDSLLFGGDGVCACPAGFEAYALLAEVFGNGAEIFEFFGSIAGGVGE